MTADEKRIVEWLRAESKSSWLLSERLPWWRLRLRFANKVAGASIRNIAKAIESGDHRKDKL